MIKNDGSNGEARSYRLDYECICGNRVGLTIGVQPQVNYVVIPELFCSKCDGLPLMARSVPVEVDAKRIVLPTIMPPDMRKAN